MPDTWFNLKKIISLVVFIAVFSMMGLSTGRPLMVIAYAVFFMAVVFVVYLLLRNRQRHFEVTSTTNPLLKKGLGALLLLFALILPAVIITRSNLVNLPVMNAGVIAAVFGVTIAFISLMLFAAYLINCKSTKITTLVLGYLIIIVTAAAPGLIMTGIERTTTGIGSVYYVALAVLILAWNGLGLTLNKD